MPRIPDEEIARIKRRRTWWRWCARAASSWASTARRTGSGDVRSTRKTNPHSSSAPDKGLYPLHGLRRGRQRDPVRGEVRRRELSPRLRAAERGPPGILGAGDRALEASHRPRLENPFEDAPEDAALLARVVEYYHERLLKTPDALDYFKAAGSTTRRPSNGSGSGSRTGRWVCGCRQRTGWRARRSGPGSKSWA